MGIVVLGTALAMVTTSFVTGAPPDDAPRFSPCGGVQVSMSVGTNEPTPDRQPGSMVADVVWQNRKGPDCSYRGFPAVAFNDQDPDHDLPTVMTERHDWPERWVNFTWNKEATRNAPGDGHFRVYSTSLGTDGQPCPEGHMVKASDLKVTLPNIGIFFVLTEPIYGGPSVSSCDGRIAVTPIAQATVH